jgi:hypothetical protein
VFADVLRYSFANNDVTASGNVRFERLAMWSPAISALRSEQR